MEKTLSDLNCSGLMLIKRKYDMVGKKLEMLNKMNNLVNYYLKQRINEGIGIDYEETYNVVKDFIFQTRVNTNEELQIIKSFFSQIYDITNDYDSFMIKFYIELIIYIKENLKNNENSDEDVYDFDFTIKSLNKEILKDMNDYFGLDLIQTVDKIQKEHELRRAK